MQTTYLTRVNYSSEYIFTVAAIKNPDKAREEWENICNENEAKQALAKKEREEYDAAAAGFKAFVKEHNVSITTRRLNGLLDEIRKSKIHTSSGFSPYVSPRWVDGSGRVVSAQGMYRNPETFEQALDAVIKDYERTLQDKEKASNREKDAIEYCIRTGIDWTPATAVDVATSHYVKTEIAEAIASGRIYSFDECDTCSEWVAGSHRCICGNRRVDLTWDGIYPDVYIYPEAW